MTQPSTATRNKLFGLSRNKCAFPECKTPAVSENSIAEVCHIKGKKPNSARYDARQTDEQRESFENLILLCPTHHSEIDKGEKKYTVEILHQMKLKHETLQPIRIVFEKCEPFIVNTYLSENGIDKKVRVLIESNKDEHLGIEVFFTLESKPYEDIPLFPKDESNFTRFTIDPRARQFIDVIEYKARNKRLRICSPTKYSHENDIAVEPNKKIKASIKVLGVIIHLVFYINEEGFQVEKIS